MRQFPAVIGFLLFCGALPASAQVSAPPQNIITTIAGTDIVFPGDGRGGSSVALGRVGYVAVDPQGRAVFSDPYYNVVVRIETDGALRVLAGNNIQGLGNSPGAGGFGGSGGGFSGDNGPATSAALNRPRGIAYDLQGNLYIADSFNNRIRMVSPSGIITTFAGNGVVGFQDGPAASAQFRLPLDLTVDNTGAVIVNDSSNHRIRKIAQGRVTTIAGNGQSGVGRPLADNAAATSVALNDVEGLATDMQGNVFFSDFTVSQVKEITQSGILQTVASNGTANNLVQPSGLAIDSSGAIYVAVTGNYQVRRITPGGATIVAGSGQEGFSGDNGAAASATLRNPTGVAVSTAGVVFIADRDNFRIRRVDASKNIATVAGNGALLSSADGQQAIYAPLLDPFGVTTDQNASLLVADTRNNLVRSIDSTGTLTTIAGNGAQEDGDQNLPATQVGLGGPVNAARDNSGNLLIVDLDASLVRQVNTRNIINDFAGMPYAPGNSGDKGPATRATLFKPSQTVTDPNGTTYIADYANGNIRIVTRDGTINTFRTGLKGPYGLALDSQNNLFVTEYDGGTVSIIPTAVGVAANTAIIAGGGTFAGSASDGLPGTNARLMHPAGIALDAARNVYFTDAGDNRVHKLTLTGSVWIISTVAGNGQAAYTGDGGPATSASLRSPFSVSVDSKSGTVFIADTGNNRIRAVQSIAPAVSASPSSLTFTLNQGGKVSDPSTIAIAASSFGHLAGMLFTASASQNWISVTPTMGATPSSLQVTVDPSALSAKTYNETVTISTPGANPPTLTIPITVTINAPPPPSLSFDTTVINAGLTAGGPPLMRQIQVINSGGQQPQVSAVATMQSGAGWLSVSPASAVSSPTAPAVLTVAINPGNLGPGTYTGRIVVTSGGNPVCISQNVCAIPVNLAINPKPGLLLLSTNALTFTAIRGGAAPLPKAINIVNTGKGSLQWNVSGAPLTPNIPNWLSFSVPGGSLDTPQTSVGTVSTSVNPAGLAVGPHYGQMQITSDNAANSPQFVTVVVNVVDASSNPGPDISATALVFAGVQGVNPSSQTVVLSNLGSQPLSYGSTRVSEDGDWIVHVPTDATIAAGQTARLVVQPDFTSLGVGTHHGVITLRFSDNSVRTIDVTSIISPGAGATSITRSIRAPRASSPCTSDPVHSLVITVTSPPQNFSVLANQATTVEATITDCNNKPTSNSATVKATCGGVPLDMKNSNGAVWTVDWTPANPATNVTISIAAANLVGTSPVSGRSSPTTGTVANRSNAPNANALANAASLVPQTPVAPGAFVTIFGSNLANNTATANAVPLTSPLAGATVTLAGRTLPILYASDKQINAQVPYDLPLFSVQQLAVKRDETLSPQVEFVVARAQPAIYTASATGQGQGVVVFATDPFVFAAPSSFVIAAPYSARAAKAGDFLTIYCNGLGPVQGNVTAGVPVTGPTPTIDTATVTIGGLNAPVLYAGLTPGIPGLYQINVQIPSGVPASDAVPVQISISGQTSPDGVTIATQ